MRIAIFTLGSYGDLQPYLALGRALMARGHTVRVHAPDHFAHHAQDASVPFVPLGPHYGDAELKRVLAALAAERDTTQHPEIIFRMTHSSTVALADRAVESTKGQELIVAHNLSMLGSLAAEANRVPYVTGHLFTSLIASSNHWLTGKNYGKPINRLLWFLAQRFLARRVDRYYADLFERFNLAPRRDMLMRAGHSALLNLVAISPHVLPADPAWPAHYLRTGYLRLPDDASPVDPALRAFVENGEPPIVVSFGSMFGVDAAALTRELVSAFSDRSCRVILQAGWAGIGLGELPEHIRRVDFVPHAWLFPRAACVVHHGGAGTTAAALHAGVPQVIVHHLGDQPCWARHMGRIGVSRHHVEHRKLHAQWLREATRDTIRDVRLKARAKAMAARLATEDGAANAVQAIERVGREGRAYQPA